MRNYRDREVPSDLLAMLSKYRTFIVKSVDGSKSDAKVCYRGVLDEGFAVVLDKHADSLIAPLCFVDALWTTDGRYEFEIEYDGQIMVTDHE